MALSAAILGWGRTAGREEEKSRELSLTFVSLPPTTSPGLAAALRRVYCSILLKLLSRNRTLELSTPERAPPAEENLRKTTSASVLS